VDPGKWGCPANAQSSMSSVPQTLGATSSLGIPDDEVEQLLTAIEASAGELLAGLLLILG